MPTKIRLQRRGKKKNAYYHVVVADVRAPRDGKFIEKLGTYNPNDNPATINIDFDKCLYWIKQGAQPTDTCRALLSYKGILYKDHLDRGVLKGALTQEQADKKFETWLNEKETKIQAKKDNLSKAAKDIEQTRLAAEKEANEKKAAEISAKFVEQEEVETPKKEDTETSVEDVQADEEPKTEVPATAKEETSIEEPKVEEKKEEPKAEASVKEENKAEKPAEDK